MFSAYIDKYCSLDKKEPNNIKQMYDKYFSEDKKLDYTKFMKMIFGEDFEVY